MCPTEKHFTQSELNLVLNDTKEAGNGRNLNIFKQVISFWYCIIKSQLHADKMESQEYQCNNTYTHTHTHTHTHKHTHKHKYTHKKLKWTATSYLAQ